MKTAVTLREDTKYIYEKRLTKNSSLTYTLPIPKSLKTFLMDNNETLENSTKVLHYCQWGFKQISDKAHQTSKGSLKISDDKLLKMSNADMETVSDILGIDLKTKKKMLLERKKVNGKVKVTNGNTHKNGDTKKTILRKHENGITKNETEIKQVEASTN